MSSIGERHKPFTMRKYQRGWVTVEGTRVKRYVGRYRVYHSNGTFSRPKLFLGLKSEITKSEARAKLDAFLRAGGSRPAPARNLTLLEYWNQLYVPTHKLRWSEPTAAGYDAYIRAYLGPAFGSTRLIDVQPEHIAAFFDKLRREHTKAVVRKCWTMLKSVFEDAVDHDVIQKNPIRKVPHPKTKIPFRPVMDKDALRWVLDAVGDNARNSAILYIAVFSAVRPAEVFGLRWRSFCDDHIVIRDSAWEGKLLEDQSKTGETTGERMVSIGPLTRAALLRWREQSKDTFPNALIFPSKKGTPISSRNFRNRVLLPIQQKVNQELRRQGKPELNAPLSFQVLRRSQATRNQRRLKDVQAHLGHRSILTTANIYAQEIPASVKEMVAADEAEIRNSNQTGESIGPK